MHLDWFEMILYILIFLPGNKYAMASPNIHFSCVVSLGAVSDARKC